MANKKKAVEIKGKMAATNAKSTKKLTNKNISIGVSYNDAKNKK